MNYTNEQTESNLKLVKEGKLLSSQLKKSNTKSDDGMECIKIDVNRDHHYHAIKIR